MKKLSLPMLLRFPVAIHLGRGGLSGCSSLRRHVRHLAKQAVHQPQRHDTDTPVGSRDIHDVDPFCMFGVG